MERVGRDRTIGAYHLDLMPMVGLTDDGMPVMMPCDAVPDDLLGFNYATGCKDPDVRRSNGVHFFLDDYQFERIWRFPLDYGDRLADFQCVLTPDYSLYRDMPLPMQRWNCYRSRFVGAVWQTMGLDVIPTLQWSTTESYSFAFDGMPTDSVVAASTVGVLNDKTATRLWVQGFEEAIRRLKPTLVLLYGKPIPGYTMPCEFIRYENHNIRRMKQWAEEEAAAPEAAETLGGGGGSSEIAARLGFTFAEENGAAALPEATKLLVAEAIQEMVDEFPSLRGSVDRIDLHKRSDPNELAGVRFNFNNHAVLALGPDFQDLAKANRDVRNGIHNGFYVKNTDLKGVIHHELGHVLERQVFLKRYTHLKNAERQFQQGKIANRIVNNASRDKTVDSDYGNFVKSNGYLKDYRTTISGYAAHSGHETIAEAVADYKRNGSNAAPLSQAIWKELKRSLNG